MKKLAAFILAIMLCLCQISALADFSDIINSTVRIYTTYSYDRVVQLYDADNYLYVPAGSVAYTGSGFAVGKAGEQVKYIVTNMHVVSTECDATAYILPRAKVEDEQGNVTLNTAYATKKIEVMMEAKPEPFIVLNSRQDMIPAYVMGYSDRADLSVLELSTPIDARVPAKLRPFEKLGREQVYAAGFPGVVDRLLDESNQLLSSPDRCSTTGGLVMRIESHAVTGEGEQIVMDTVINGGNSGGPLVDKNGYVLGVNTWGANNAQTTTGAVSVNEVVRLLNQLNVPYQTAGSFDWMNIAYIALGVVLLVLVVLIVALAGKKKSSKYMLVGLVGELRGKAFRLGATTVIGRDKSCQIILSDEAHGVSGRHCTITVKNNVVTVVDSSSYGTWIDKTKLPIGTPTTLKQGQTLYLGSAKQGLMLK